MEKTTNLVTFWGGRGLLRHPYGPTNNQNNVETSSVRVETRPKRRRPYHTTFHTHETSSIRVETRSKHRCLYHTTFHTHETLYSTTDGASAGFHTRFGVSSSFQCWIEVSCNLVCYCTRFTCICFTCCTSCFVAFFIHLLQIGFPHGGVFPGSC
jgi:hypothetical protein